MTRSTSARDTILAAVRSALPRPAVELPALPNSEQQFGAVGGVGYRGHLTSLEPVTRPSPDCESLVPYFQSQLEAMGGKSFVIASLSEAEMKFRECFPQAGVVCSTIRELPGNRPLDATQDARDFADVEVAVFRSHLGIAEAGAIWLSDADLVIPAVGVLTQHLVVVLDPADIVATLHEARASEQV